MQVATKQAQKLVHDGLLALNRATRYGMKVNVPYLKKMDRKLSKRLKVLEAKVKVSSLGKEWSKTYGNWNINSDAQLRTILFDKLEMPVLKITEKGKQSGKDTPSVDNETLTLLSDDLPDLKLVNDYKRIHTAHKNFIIGILREQVNGYLHPGFPLHKVLSFRGSSENVNFQNQPKRDALQKAIVRKAFIPRKGQRLGEADYSGIEVRGSCCVTKDKKLTYDTIHGDMHRDMAIEIYMLDEFLKEGAEKYLRNGAKNGFVFPQFYGDYWGNNAPSLLKWAELPTSGKFKKKQGRLLMTGKHIGQHLIEKGIPNVESFTKHIENIEDMFWNERYKTYGKWKERQVKQYEKKGYLKTVTGFVCQGIMSKNQITNYPIQGPAFHTLLKAFIEVDRLQQKYNWKSRLIGQIHDAMVLDIYPKETDEIMEVIGEVMTIWVPKKFKWITVPLEVEADIFDIDASWASESETRLLHAA